MLITVLGDEPQIKATTSPVQIVTLTNSGTAALNVSNIAVSSDFALASGTTCPSNGPVAVQASCLISVTFTPTATGGTALVHRIPPVGLKCLSEMRRREMAALVGGTKAARRG